MLCGLCSTYPHPTTASPSQAPSGPDPGQKLQAAPQQGVHRPALLLLARSFAGLQGWAFEPEGLVPALPSRGEKAAVGAGKRASCGTGSGTAAPGHATLDKQIQWGPEKPQSSCRQMFGLFFRDSTSYSTRTLPSPALGPPCGELGAQLAPEQLDLPSSLSSTTEPSSPILAAGEGVEQSRAPKPGTPPSQLLVVLGGGTENILHSYPTAPSQCPAPPCCLAHGTDGTQTLQLLLGAPPASWSVQPGCTGRVLLGLGQLLAVLAQPACPHSHSSVPAGPQSVELSQDCSSTRPALHQLCSKPCGAGGRQRRVPPGSLPQGWDPACRCPVPGQPQAGLFPAQG